MKKIFLTFLISLLSLQLLVPRDVVEAAISPQISEFLCEKGISYYDLGKYPEALTEFKKALLANPESAVAKEYISTIEEAQPETRATTEEDILKKKVSYVNSVLNTMEEAWKNKPEITGVKKRSTPVTRLQGTSLQEFEKTIASQKQAPQSPQKTLINKAGLIQAQQPAQETVIDIDAKPEGDKSFEIETNVAEHLRMTGNNISRFLVVQPALLKVSRIGSGELLVEPLDLGVTTMHIWDDGGRKTYKFTINPRRLEEQLYRAYQERSIEAGLPESFKFSYSIEGDSFYTGRGFGDLKQVSNVYAYSSSLIGETPYGNFDSAVEGSRTSAGQYSVSNLRMGITNGHYDQFKNITLRAFDFSPNFNAFGFPLSDLRGAMVQAPMFNSKIDYTAFWGAIPRGNFTQLATSSGLSQTKEAWLEGLGLNFRPTSFLDFKTFRVHSYGPERTQPVLTSDNSGFGMHYFLGRFNLDSEMAYDDIGNISYTARTMFNLSKLRIGLSNTDTSKKFASVFGGQPAGGSTNRTLSLTYVPVKDVTISNSFSATWDKVFGNPDRPGRPNYNSDTRLNWTLDPQTEMEVGYTFDDQLGSISPTVTETKEVEFRKKFFFFRTLSTYLTYQNNKSKNYTSPAQDYNNNKIMMGVSSRLLYDVYGYYRREFNYLHNNFTGETAFPAAQEVGLSYYHQIFNTPFYTNLRIFYRMEESTESVLSFLSGEDRLEGEGELTYKPNPDTEAFLKARVTNIWAAKEGVAKHLDLDLNWGLRIVWDTGLRWQSVGGFYGYVFYDINGDGIRQPNEKGAKGVEIKGPNGRKVVTDETGYYKISGVSGRKALLELNLQTVPRGYSPTTSTSKEMDVVHAKTKRLDFGITTRSEISGLVFNDKNGNGQYDSGEETIKGVVLILDDKTKTATSPLGEYMFRKLSPGEHVIKVDLKSVPVQYIPKVAVFKNVRVLEGVTFVYNIPLQELKKK